MGTIGGENTVSGECLFVNPVADIAVLGCPDSQERYEEATAYDALVYGARALRKNGGLAKPVLIRLALLWLVMLVFLFGLNWSRSFTVGSI